MHDRFLAALQDVADVRLVAALKDDRLGFPATNDLRIFIPDLHLISEKRRKQGKFRYATNHTDLLASVVRAIRALKVSLDPSIETLVLYQVGDFLDLWREAASGDDRLQVASRIKDDHEELVEALLDPELKARFLLGNHDFDLYRWPSYRAWERRYYLPDTTVTSPSVIVLHGDVFDWIEKLPDAIQRVFVYLFAPHLSPNDYALGDMRALVERSHGKRLYTTYIQARSSSDVGTLTAPNVVPPRWNLQIDGSAPASNMMFLGSAADACAKANKDYALDLRVVVIGHTHHARIAIREDGEHLFTLIDCGAWIEGCVTSTGESMLNAQLAALSGNEARIYQLGPLPG
jgi:UDP-2,3-diacylglucosamine pyrophosphatase LpxH